MAAYWLRSMHHAELFLAFLGNANWREGLVLVAVIATLIGLRWRRAAHGR